MKTTGLLAFLFVVCLPAVLCSQDSRTAKEPEGFFAYAANARRLIVVAKDVNESQARLLTKAVCPTDKITAKVTLRPVNQGSPVSGFQYDADRDLPAGNYCLLVDDKAHPKVFVWGSGDEPLLVGERACLGEITQAAKRLTGRTPRTCYLTGVYGTGRVDLVEFASESPDDRLAVLMVTDESPVDGSRYSLARFPASSPVWTMEKDGKFHPERFRHLFTISKDPESNLWLFAVDWAGPAGHDLTLYQPVGNELRPVVMTHDASHGKKPAADLASN